MEKASMSSRLEKNMPALKQEAVDGILELAKQANHDVSELTQEGMRSSWASETLLKWASAILPAAIVRNYSEDGINLVFQSFLSIGKQLEMEAEAKRLCFEKYRSSQAIKDHIKDFEKLRKLGIVDSEEDLARLEKEIMKDIE